MMKKHANGRVQHSALHSSSPCVCDFWAPMRENLSLDWTRHFTTLTSPSHRRAQIFRSGATGNSTLQSQRLGTTAYWSVMPITSIGSILRLIDFLRHVLMAT